MPLQDGLDRHYRLREAIDRHLHRIQVLNEREQRIAIRNWNIVPPRMQAIWEEKDRICSELDDMYAQKNVLGGEISSIRLRLGLHS